MTQDLFAATLTKPNPNKSIEEKHLESNPNDSRKEIESAIQDALSSYKKGERCQRGTPIWVIGSAFVGNACFKCITGEAMPNEDYEIDEALR